MDNHTERGERESELNAKTALQISEIIVDTIIANLDIQSPLLLTSTSSPPRRFLLLSLFHRQRVSSAPSSTTHIPLIAPK